MDKRLKTSILLITYTVALYFAFLHINWFIDGINNILWLIMPFIYGIIIAYIVNWPYTFFKRKLFNKIGSKKNSSSDLSKIGKKMPIFANKDKLVNMISLVFAYIFVLGIAAFLIIIIAPQLIVSIKQLIDNFSMYVESFKSLITILQDKLSIQLISVESNQKIWDYIISHTDSFKDTIVPSIFNFTKTFATKIYNWILGIIVSMYLLGSKDKLIRQTKKIILAFTPALVSSKIKELFYLTHHTFWRFLVGKFIDSGIIGILCFIGMSILSIPYAILISVVVGITNIIPFFGPFIGAIPSILILIMIDPIKALYFALFIFVLQQVDGNIIGPRILGNSVGVSGLWIMFSVIIGGGLFGILGMVAGVPVFAVIYTLLKQVVNNRLKRKNKFNEIIIEEQ